jgi:hypothetical protein
VKADGFSREHSNELICRFGLSHFSHTPVPIGFVSTLNLRIGNDLEKRVEGPDGLGAELIEFQSHKIDAILVTEPLSMGPQHAGPGSDPRRQVGQRPSDKKAKRVLGMHADGLSYRLIARKVGLNRNTVMDIVRRNSAG